MARRRSKKSTLARRAAAWRKLPKKALAYRPPHSSVFVIGLGQSKRLNPDALGRVLAKATEVLKRANAEAIAIELPGEGVLDDGTRAGALKAQLLPGFQKAKVAVLGGRQLGRLVGAE